MVGLTGLLLGCGKSDGEGARVTPCGGDLVGEWGEMARDATYPANPAVNECWNLNGSFSPEGYSASSVFPLPSGRATLLRFDDMGSYYGTVLRVGPVTVNYAAACLATDQGSPTCTQLQEALGISGLAEGWYGDPTCVEQTGGGCSCTVQVFAVGSLHANWLLNPDHKSIHLNDPNRYPDPLDLDLGYCIKDGGLRFDGPLDGGEFASYDYTADVTFGKPNCDGTAQQLSTSFGTACELFCGQTACGLTP